VLEEHYPVVLESLKETIREELGELFTERIGKAWEKALINVTNKMKKYASTN